MVVLFSQERDPDDFTIPADLASTQPYIRLLTAADMKKSKQVEVSGSPQDITRQISSISFSLGRSTNHIDHTEAATERIRGEPPVNNQRNSVVETLELSPLPLGLVDEDDSFARSIIPVRHRNEAQPAVSISPVEKRKGKNDPKQDKETSPGSVNHHRVNIRPLSSNNFAAVVVPDLNEYSSTSELIPLSIAALKDEKSRRLLWLDNASLMAMSLTLANIWRLPTFLYFNYPGEALIAYVTLMIIVGLPLYVLELSLGQFSQTGITKLWSAVPFFQGIGIAQMMAGVYQAFYFPTLMTWAFQYGILGIGDWSSCENSSTPQNLTVNLCPEPRNGKQFYGVISKEENCFESHVLHHVGENMNYKMLPMLAVAMILVILGASFGTKVMKIVLSISGVLTAIILSASLALALTHPNNSIDGSNNTALHGISLLSPTEPWVFGRGEVWYGAMVQVIFSLALGFGTLPSQTSKSYFTRNVIRDGVVTWLVNLLFAIISVLTVFAWVGISGLDSTNVVKTNAFIYFVYYNISGSLWAGLVFALIFLAGLNSMLPLLYAILQNLSENFPILKKRYRAIISFLLLVVFWIVNVPGLIPVGNEVVMIWDHYAAGATVLSCLIVHMIGWLWAYGRKNLKRDLECMIVRPISGFWIFSWSFVTIILLTIAELWGFFGVPLDGTVDCLYPIWVVAAGWSFYLLALVVALVIIIKTVVNQAEYGLVKKLATSMKPDRHWGPQDPLFHSHWKRTVDQQPGILPYSRGNTITRWLKEDAHEEMSSPISNENVVSNRRQQSANITLVHLPRQRHHDENGLAIE